ncbi:MAG TPA: hypothetical protein VHW71_04095 [Steroidobacteraceae bacterium]|jgi:hypothetical protein|nr:hypothetical protein [Steroidobacteraceae bacterium]
MSKDLESQLRAALRPVAPRKEFTERLVARGAAGQADRRAVRSLAARGIRPLAWWVGASLAASVLLAIGIQQHLEQQRLQRSGLEARREVVEALRMTSQKLNLAYEAVKSQSTSRAAEQSGA